MEKLYKIAAVGDPESVMGFMAAGFVTVYADDPVKAGEAVKKLADTGEYAVIFVVENYFVEIGDVLERYLEWPLPAIISVPGKNGASGVGVHSVRKSVERAIGADILFKTMENKE